MCHRCFPIVVEMSTCVPSSEKAHVCVVCDCVCVFVKKFFPPPRYFLLLSSGSLSHPQDTATIRDPCPKVGMGRLRAHLATRRTTMKGPSTTLMVSLLSTCTMMSTPSSNSCSCVAPPPALGKHKSCQWAWGHRHPHASGGNTPHTVWGLKILWPAQSCLLTTWQDLPGTISQLMTSPPVKATKQYFVMLQEPASSQGNDPGQTGQPRPLRTMEPQLDLGRQWKSVQRMATRSTLPGSGQVHTCLLERVAGQGRVFWKS